MSFTDKFMQLPIKAYKPANESTGDQAKYKRVTGRIDPTKILTYFNAFPDAEGDAFIALDIAGGDSIAVYMSMPEFERAINDYFNKSHQDK